MIELADGAIEKIRSEGEKAYPGECCGLLIGLATRRGHRVALAFPCRNLMAGLANDRYEVDPQDFLKADRLARDEGLEVIGAYHSHPDHPPEPSRVDAQEAIDGFVYVIVEVQMGRAAGMRSWLYLGERGFREQAIIRATG